MAANEQHYVLPLPVFHKPVKLLIVVAPYYKDITDNLVAGARAVAASCGAEVDLSAAFASGGGSLSMLTRVAQAVYTLTAFPTVHAVRFLIEGERVDAIGGEGVIVDPPPTRADLPGQAPASP